jgi:hypothetical protein
LDGQIVDSSDDESKVVKLSDAQKYAKDVLNFMASQGSQIFNAQELLGMEKIHDKLMRIGVGHLTSLKQCDIRSSRGDHSLLYFAYTCVHDLFIGGVIYLAKKIIR